MSTKARAAFELLKKDLGNVFLMSINENQDLTVETDASIVAISATLNPNSMPIPFFEDFKCIPKIIPFGGKRSNVNSGSN